MALFCFFRTARANRQLGISLLGIGALLMAGGSWVKGSLHLAGRQSNFVDFFGGLAIGLGISFFVVSFSTGSDVEDTHLE